jgi:hypothetical protein
MQINHLLFSTRAYSFIPSYQPWQQREDDMRTFTGFLEDAERHRRPMTFGGPLASSTNDQALL